MATSESASAYDIAAMDDSAITREHWKVVFISGMGFFTDAYDLFIIGVVLVLLKQQWQISKLEEGLVGSTALLAAAFGAVLFGRIADMLGRRRMYGVEVLVLAVSAIACAFCSNIWWLIGFRFIMGFGIGGDYPVSATIMSEYSGKKSRGLMVSLVFGMQAVGLIMGPLFAAAMLATGLSHDIIWRILVGFGAVPALAVYWQRRHLKETPRYLKAAAQEKDESARLQNTSDSGTAPRSISFWEGFRRLVNTRRLLSLLVGSSAAWFLMDFAYYGNTVSSPLVLSALHSDHTLLQKTLTQLGIFVIFAAPGYALSAYFMDRIGRKTIQCAGFAIMAICFAVIGFVPGISNQPIFFLVVYGISYLFTEFGPNATTFIYPSEIFPVKVRTTGHGIATCMGKLGAFVGVFTFPFFMHWKGLAAAEGAAAIVSVLGLLVTVFLLPETKGRSLEEISADPAAQKVAA